MIRASSLATARTWLWLCAAGQAVLGSASPLPIHLPAEAPAHVRAAQNRIYQAALKQAHYLLGTVHPWKEDAALRLLTESRSGEHWIRPNAGAVEGFAFLHRFGPYDEKVIGISRAELLRETLVPMMRYLVATHLTGVRPTSDGKPWGDAWQSAHWTQMLGRGAWFVWADLPDDLREGVRRVVAHEADRIARSEPPHQLRSDTKAEENAWNSQVLSVAALLSPTDVRRAGWDKAHQRWVMSSFLRPADEQNDTLVDGHPVREQFTGANLFDDFTLENHNLVHPDYMTTFSLSLGCAPDFALTGRRMPEALLFNVAPIYENLKWIYEQGRRRVVVDGQSIEVATGCGQPWQWEAAGRIKVDDAFEIVSRPPLRAAYLAAEGAERGRATDRLILNYLPGNRTWVSGAVISDYQAVIRCRE